MIWIADSRIILVITLKLCDGCVGVEHFIVIPIVHNSQHTRPGWATRDYLVRHIKVLVHSYIMFT
jgi:hypothetical protein